MGDPIAERKAEREEEERLEEERLEEERKATEKAERDAEKAAEKQRVADELSARKAPDPMDEIAYRQNALANRDVEAEAAARAEYASPDAAKARTKARLEQAKGIVTLQNTPTITNAKKFNEATGSSVESDYGQIVGLASQSNAGKTSYGLGTIGGEVQLAITDPENGIQVGAKGLATDVGKYDAYLQETTDKGTAKTVSMTFANALEVGGSRTESGEASMQTWVELLKTEEGGSQIKPDFEEDDFAIESGDLSSVDISSELKYAEGRIREGDSLADAVSMALSELAQDKSFQTLETSRAKVFLGREVESAVGKLFVANQNRAVVAGAEAVSQVEPQLTRAAVASAQTKPPDFFYADPVKTAESRVSAGKQVGVVNGLKTQRLKLEQDVVRQSKELEALERNQSANLFKGAPKDSDTDDRGYKKGSYAAKNPLKKSAQEQFDKKVEEAQAEISTRNRKGDASAVGMENVLRIVNSKIADGTITGSQALLALDRIEFADNTTTTKGGRELAESLGLPAKTEQVRTREGISGGSNYNIGESIANLAKTAEANPEGKKSLEIKKKQDEIALTKQILANNAQETVFAEDELNTFVKGAMGTNMYTQKAMNTFMVNTVTAGSDVGTSGASGLNLEEIANFGNMNEKEQRVHIGTFLLDEGFNASTKGNKKLEPVFSMERTRQINELKEGRGDPELLNAIEGLRIRGEMFKAQGGAEGGAEGSKEAAELKKSIQSKGISEFSSLYVGGDIEGAESIAKNPMFDDSPLQEVMLASLKQGESSLVQVIDDPEVRKETRTQALAALEVENYDVAKVVADSMKFFRVGRRESSGGLIVSSDEAITAVLNSGIKKSHQMALISGIAERSDVRGIEKIAIVDDYAFERLYNLYETTSKDTQNVTHWAHFMDNYEQLRAEAKSPKYLNNKDGFKKRTNEFLNNKATLMARDRREYMIAKLATGQ